MCDGCAPSLPSRIFPCRTRRHHLPEETAMPSFTTAAKDEILSNKAVRQHFPNQQSFGLMVFSREFSVQKMQMLTRERRAAQY